MLFFLNNEYCKKKYAKKVNLVKYDHIKNKYKFSII